MGPATSSTRLSLPAQAFLIIALGAPVDGCDSPRAEPSDSGPADASVGSASDAGLEVNAITSATPLAKNITLTETHQGWLRADCVTCHPLNHDSSYGTAACASCHGGNGAPPRPLAAHPSFDDCSTCHGGAHDGASLRSPDDCVACHTYPPGETCGFTESYDVVVIGAGGGGLSAAAALARAGKSVTVLEKNYKVGGCMTNFNRGPYRFEASLHGFDGLVDGSGMNVDVFKALGIWDKVQILRPDPMYRVIYPDFTYDIPADAEEYETLLIQEFPAEAEGITNLFTEMRDVDRILKEVLSAQANGQQPDVTNDDLLKLQSYMDVTLMEVLDRYIQDPKLVAVWTQLAGFAGTEPSEVSAIFFMAMWNSYYLGGYHYFIGGSQAVIDALAEVVTDEGGVIRPNSLVSRVVIENGRATQVQTADGACYDAAYVVSNANAPDLVTKLVGRDELPDDYVQRVDSLSIGLSAFVVYLGVDYDYRDIFGTTHEIMLNEGYDPHDPFQAVIDCEPEQTAIALANYSAIDPTAAPEGKNVITITTQLGYDCFDEWYWTRSHQDYRLLKEELAQLYIERAESVLPGLSEHIEVMEVATPMTISGFTANPRGTIFGWDNTPEQSIQGRLAQRTPIPNLYLAGAWTFPGGGQSAVLISGSTAAKAILDAMER